jgi:hypothetical protein
MLKLCLPIVLTQEVKSLGAPTPIYSCVFVSIRGLDSGLWVEILLEG